MTDVRTDPIGFAAIGATGPAATGTAPAASETARRRYRPELQGLRALAALLVVVYHVWLGRVSGGVDVFFLVSGFLITGQLARASARGGIRFGPLWGRMIKRLFPAALTVLLLTMAGAALLLPETRWLQTIREVIASALYFENWQLAADSVDYFAQHDSASVVQHFWSLSIQGQFYLVWPVLVAVVAFAAHRARLRLRPTLAVVLALLFCASLAYSVVLTATNQPLAYFSSLTRIWEFALGGLLALGIDAIALPGVVRVVLGWLGVAGLVSCGLVLQVGSVFPGYLALWPVLSAALVLVAGGSGHALGADRFLASRPMVYLGNLSFALYLWHWPVLVLHLVAQERAEPTPVTGTIVIGFSLGLAALTYHFVEQPLRESRIGARGTWGAYRFGALALVPVLVAALSWQWLSADRARTQAEAIGDEDHPGAAALLDGFEYRGSPDAALTPSLLALPEEYATIGDCGTPEGTELDVCATPVEGTPERTIMVVGDSHAQQLIAALVPIAEARNWQVVSVIRHACPFSSQALETIGDQPCATWNDDLIDEIAGTHPDAVVAMASRDAGAGRTERTPPGYVEQWHKLDELGIPVVAVRDNPRFAVDPSECIETHGPQAPECSTPRSELLLPEPPYLALDGLPANVSFVDLSDYYCRPDVCPSVVGNVVVYMDDNHITATYMRTVSPMLQDRFDAALGWN